MVTLQVAKRTYQMTRAGANKVLELARKSVPVGIYAVEKDNVIICVKEPLTKTQAKQRRREYIKKGFRVYASGI